MFTRVMQFVWDMFETALNLGDDADRYRLFDALILFLKETVRLGRIPFDYTEEDLGEARKWERIVNDDVQDTGGEETCMVN